MDDYEGFIVEAKIYTQIHAKPNECQRAIIMDRRRAEQRDFENNNSEE
jgi:hypothetical protein